MLLPIYTPNKPGEEETTPLANMLLVGLIAGTSALSFLFGSLAESTLFEDPLQELALQRTDWSAWQLIGSSFLHANVLHLVTNLVCLIALGNLVNRKLGNAKYLLLFLASTVAGGLAWIWLGSGAVTLGASAGIFGVAAAFVVLCPRREVQTFLPLPWLVIVALVMAFFGLGIRPRPVALLALGFAILGVLAVYVLGTILEIVLREERPSLLRGLGWLVGLRFPKLAGMWVVLAIVAWDLFNYLTAAGLTSVASALSIDLAAHEAHLGGLVAGFAVTILACAFGGVLREGTTSVHHRPVPATRRVRRGTRRTRRLSYSEWANRTLQEVS